MDNIGASIELLQSAMKGKLAEIHSSIQPVVLPQDCPFRNISDFFTNADVKLAVDAWILRHNPDHVVFLTEVDYLKSTIFVTEIRIVSHEDVELYNLEGMIKKMTIGNAAELQIYMDRFAPSPLGSSSSTFSSSKLRAGADSDDSEDSDDSDRLGSSEVRMAGNSSSSSSSSSQYYHCRGAMNEVYSLAYSLKVLITNISGWSFALRCKRPDGIDEDDADDSDDDDDDDVGDEGDLSNSAFNLPIKSSNAKMCLSLVKTLVVSAKGSKSSNNMVSSKHKTNSKSKSNSNSNSSSSSGGGHHDDVVKMASPDGSDSDDDDDDDDDNNNMDNSKKGKVNKKRKRKRGGGKN